MVNYKIIIGMMLMVICGAVLGYAVAYDNAYKEAVNTANKFVIENCQNDIKAMQNYDFTNFTIQGLK